MTFYLLAYNNFEFSSFRNLTIIPAERIDGFGNRDLLFIKKDAEAVKKGDKILFYNSYEAKSEILIEKVLASKEEHPNEITYLLESDRFLSSTYLIGKQDEICIIPYVGILVGFLSSRITFFTFIIIPSAGLLILGIRELYYLKKGRR